MFCVNIYGPGLLIYPVMMTRSQWLKGQLWNRKRGRGVTVGDLPPKSLSRERYNEMKEEMCLVTLRQKSYDELYEFLERKLGYFSSYHPSYCEQFVRGMYSLLEFIHPPNQVYNLRRFTR